MDLDSLKTRRNEVAALLKTLGHPARLTLVCTLAEGERTVSELVEECGLTQSYTSQGLKRMETEKLLKSRREGGFTWYSIADPRLVSLLKNLKSTYCPR